MPITGKAEKTEWYWFCFTSNIDYAIFPILYTNMKMFLQTNLESIQCIMSQSFSNHPSCTQADFTIMPIYALKKFKTSWFHDFTSLAYQWILLKFVHHRTCSQYLQDFTEKCCLQSCLTTQVGLVFFMNVMQEMLNH